jgi:beta-lactam-binding protein with PASTA domain
VYANGCVLYEFLCGHPPFVGDSPVSVAYQHVREDPKPPSTSNRDVPPPVDAVVLKALAKYPLNRYQSAAEMRADLLRASAGRPVYAEPVLPSSETGGGGRSGGVRPVPARVGGSQRRRTSGWAIAALTALAVLAVVALVAGLIVSQQPDKQTVPALVGKTKTDADKLLTDRKLVPEATAVKGTDCTPNLVTKQSVGANARVEEGTKVAYEWCAGPGTVVIPPILNLTTANATKQLTDLGLQVKTEDADSEKPKDTVVDSVPPVGEQVAQGTVVTLKISNFKFRLLPNVAGKGYSESEAKAILGNAGFTNVKTVPQITSNPAENGKVLQQNPAPDQPKDPAATVTILVGKYDAPTSPPASPT